MVEHSIILLLLAGEEMLPLLDHMGSHCDSLVDDDDGVVAASCRVQSEPL